jgi:hypothetical protein
MSASPPASAGTNPLEEARNPQTNPRRLWELAKMRGEVANAVAANPNTPTSTLLWLAGSCWEAFLINPVLPLLLLEDPGLPLRLPTPALLTLLRQDEPPPEFLRTLQRHDDPEVRDAARLHRRAGSKVTGNPLLARLESAKGSGLALRELLSVGLVPPWLLRWAMESESKALRELAWNRAKQSDDEVIREHQKRLRWFEWLGTRKPKKEYAHLVTSERLAEFAEGGVFTRQLAAKNRATPPEVLQRLATESWQPPVVRRFAAKNPNTPAAALLTLAMTGDKAMREAVVRNPSTPAAALEQLATAPEVNIRRRIAANRNTPSAALARLAQDADRNVRIKVAFNPSADLATLTTLAQDKERNVRQRLAQRAGCPLEILKLLCKDASAYVRIGAVDNANFPNRKRNELKLRWMLDKHEEAWSDATKMPSVLDFPDEQVPPEALRPYSERRDTAPEVLAQQAAHPEVQLRSEAAGREETPPEALLALARDPEVNVRRNAALNKKLPADAYASLAADSEPSIRTCLASRHPLPPELFDQLLHDENDDVWRATLCNPHLPAERKDAEVRARFSPEVAKKLEHSLGGFPEVTVLWLLEQHPELAKAYGLRNHPSAAVRSKIISLLDNLGRTDFINTLRYSGRRENLAPLTDEQMLQLMETTDDQYGFWRERAYCTLLEYQHITPHVLETLARRQILPASPRGYQRSRAHRGGSLAMIAAHPRTPPALLAELAQYWNKRVRLAALNNPATPPEARAIRAQHAIGEAARSSSLLGRVCALTHPGAPAASLRRAAFDGTWTERYSVAQNPKCPRDLLALLREDANVAVRDAARAQWQARFGTDQS